MKKLTIFLLLASCTGIGSHAAAGTIKSFKYEGHDYITVVDCMGYIVRGGYFMHDPECCCKKGIAYKNSQEAALEIGDDEQNQSHSRIKFECN